jgi:probable HAF family extracellular repeat protein
MNERGQVVGAAETTARYTPAQDAARAKLGMPVQQAFVWEKGTMRDLGVRFGGPGSWAVAINERGEVVGAAETKAVEESGHHATHAFLWQEGVVRDLGTLPGGTSSSAVAINDRGQVVGVSCRETSSHRLPACRAFIWQNGTLTDLGTLGGDDTQPVDINERGQIVGTATTGKMGANRSPLRHAFLWQDGKMTDLGTLGGPRSGASAINDRGQVVGQATTREKSKGAFRFEPFIVHAFLWQDGKFTDLGILGKDSRAVAINAHGGVIGDTGRHAFLWRDGKMTDLGTVPGQTISEAVAISERDQVVGTTYDDGRTRSRAFLWQNGTMTELASHEQGFPDSQAVAVNGNNQIVGQRWARTKPLHVARAVLWTLKP